MSRKTTEGRASLALSRASILLEAAMSSNSPLWTAVAAAALGRYYLRNFGNTVKATVSNADDAIVDAQS